MSDTKTYAWDFRGPRAHVIAEHHATHLREFLAKHAVADCEVWVEKGAPFAATAFLRVASEPAQATVEKALRPPRVV